MIAIVFVFTVPEGAGSSGALPWAVWSRQLPRLLVSTLNGDEDRGLRFFPFLGVQGGKRAFLEPRDPLPVTVLAQIHGQSEQPDFLVDGVLREHLLQLRVHEQSGDGRTQEIEMPFDPRHPFLAMRRAAFELQGILGLRFELGRSPALEGGDLRAFLLARDALLALEASLLVEGVERSIDLALQSFRTDPKHRECGNLLVETGRHLVRHGVGVERVVAALKTAVDEVEDCNPALAGIAELLDACRAHEEAVVARVRLAECDLMDADAVLAAGNGLFRVDEVGRAGQLLRSALEAGNLDSRIRAQLAACEELRGNLGARDELLEQLAGRPEQIRAPGPARFVATWLIDRGEPRRAIAVLDQVLADHQRHAGLWLELGRAHLGIEDLETARRDLARCLELRPDESMRGEARRLLGLARSDSALPRILGIERLVTDQRLEEALREAKALVKDRKESPEAHLLLGVVRQRRGEFPKAIRSFRRALKLDARNAEAHNRLGILLVEQGKPEIGANHLRHAVDLAPHDASCWLHFAQGSAAIGEIGEARDALQRAERLGTHDEVCAAVRERLELG